MAALPVNPSANETDLSREIARSTIGVASFRVSDEPTYHAAAELVRDIAGSRKRVVEFFGPMKDQAFRTHREICARESEMLKPIAAAEAHVKAEIGRWTAEQERIRAERERALREQFEREQAEALELQIEAAEAQGASVEEVAAIMAMPVPAPAAVVAPAFERADGISTAKRYRAEVFDVKALCRAIGAGTVPVNYVSPNLPALNSAARASREMLSVPGVRVVAETTVSTRTR